MNYKKAVVIMLSTICISFSVSSVSHTTISSVIDKKTAGAESVLEKRSVDEIRKRAGVENVLNDGQERTLWGYDNLGIADVEGNLNIRAIAAEDGRIIGKLSGDGACEIIDFKDSWAHIKSGKVDGYVAKDYLLMGAKAEERAEQIVKKMATVTTDTLKVRGEPNTESEVVTLIPKGEELEVVDEKNGWVKIMIDADTAYISEEYVTIEEKLEQAVSMTELLYGEGVSDVRVGLCQYAKQFVGNPYVWGGVSLTRGADCSGFVMSVFSKYGMSLPHSSRSQAKYGKKINALEAQPGDLFFYAKGGSINHVAIYIGNGQVVHASSPSTGIRISNAFYRTPAAVRRIIVT